MTVRIAARSFVLAMVLVGPLRGQSVAVLERQLATAAAQRDSMSRSLDAYRGRHRQQALSDTLLMAGMPIRVVTTPPLRALVKDAANRAEESLRREFGENARALGPLTLFVDSAPGSQSGWVGTGSFSGENRVYNRTVPNKAPEIAAAFTTAAKAGLLDRLDIAFRRHMAGILPIDTVLDVDWSGVRMVLATSVSFMAKRCLDQDVAACKQIVGIDSVGDPATMLFDAQGRRDFVEERNYYSSVERAARQECLAGKDRECIRLVRAEGPAVVLGGRGHVSLAREAFRMGGAGALDRLIHAHGNEATVDAAMANAPIDAVVASWARKVRESGAVSTAFSPMIGVVAVGWILLFLVLSLRSSRWR